jgi:hypothetical protein
MLKKLNDLLKGGIDPKWIVVLAWLVGVQKGIGQGAISLTNMVPDSWIPHVVAWNNGLAWLGVGLMGLFAALSSNASGPLISVPNISLPSIDTKTVAKVLLVAFALSFLVAGGSAHAQIKLKSPQQIGQDLQNAIAGGTADKPAAALDSIATVLARPFQDIANFIGADADGAVTLSTAVPNIQDGHGQQCWIAMQSFGAIIKEHPVPITFHVINDYESLRLLGIATNNLCSNVHCTQVFADFTAMAQAASPMPLAIPSLHDLCTKVPQIAVVAPVSVPAPAPVAAPAATPSPAK